MGVCVCMCGSDVGLGVCQCNLVVCDMCVCV